METMAEFDRTKRSASSGELHCIAVMRVIAPTPQVGAGAWKQPEMPAAAKIRIELG